MKFVFVILLASNLMAQTKALSFEEKKQTEQSVRNLYKKAIKHYYQAEINFEEAAKPGANKELEEETIKHYKEAIACWNGIKKLDSTQKPENIIKKTESRIEIIVTKKTDDDRPSDFTAPENIAKTAYRGGKYGLARDTYRNLLGKIEKQEWRENLSHLNRVINIVGNEQYTKTGNNERNVRRTVTAFLEQDRETAAEIVVYLSRKYPKDNSLQELKRMVAEKYANEINLREAKISELSDMKISNLDELYVRKISELFRSGRIIEATDYCNKVLNLDPNNIEALVFKGTIFLKEENRDEALEMWRKSLQVNYEKSREGIIYWLNDDSVKGYGLFPDEETLADFRKKTRDLLDEIKK